MADQTQKPEPQESGSQHHNTEDVDNSTKAPNPTDLEFFNDPLIYEQGDVTRTEKHGTESGHSPLGNRRADEDIKGEINRLMAWQSTIDAAGIQVDVKDGVVTLSGKVGSANEKQVAENITRNVLGIRDVNNHLNIKSQDTEDQK